MFAAWTTGAVNVDTRTGMVTVLSQPVVELTIVSAIELFPVVNQLTLIEFVPLPEIIIPPLALQLKLQLGIHTAE